MTREYLGHPQSKWIARMLLAKEMRANGLLAKSDSLLVTGQVTGEYQAKDPPSNGRIPGICPGPEGVVQSVRVSPRAQRTECPS